MSKIQNLNGTHNTQQAEVLSTTLFMMSKIQNLNGTHNTSKNNRGEIIVVYDVKDTKFEWNSQREYFLFNVMYVVYDVKDTKFEWNSQPSAYVNLSSCSCL